MNGYINTLDGQLSIQSVMRIVLECSNIIETSNSPDTVIGRCQLLKANVGYMRDCREQSEFNIELQNSIDQFKQIYYDKLITETQISLLVSANQDQYNQFFYENIKRSSYNYVDSQIAQMSSLKRQKAIDARKSKLVTQVSWIRENVNECFLTTSYPYSEKTDELLKDLYKYLEQKLENIAVTTK